MSSALFLFPRLLGCFLLILLAHQAEERILPLSFIFFFFSNFENQQMTDPLERELSSAEKNTMYQQPPEAMTHQITSISFSIINI